MRRLHETVRFYVIPLVAAISLFLFVNHFAAAEEQPQVRFNWAFAALTGSGNNQTLIPVNKKTVLHTGDRLKILLEPLSEFYIYVFYNNSQGELVMLLPPDGFGTPVMPAIKYRVPDGNLWFKLDAFTGFEKFYLIASTKQLEQLESLYHTHTTLSDPDEVASSTAAILTEIKNLRRKHSNLTAVAERPVRLGGDFRGTQAEDNFSLPDISQIAVEISASSFFSRTFTIDHK